MSTSRRDYQPQTRLVSGTATAQDLSYGFATGAAVAFARVATPLMRPMASRM